MSDLGVSVCVLAGIVLASELARLAAARLLSGLGSARIYAAELISTVQLCACTHELKLLSDAERVGPRVGLSLTYVITVVHALTFRDAIGNPTGAIERLWRGGSNGGDTAARLACQLAGAVAARSVARGAWALGLSELHAQHAMRGFGCFSSVNAAPLAASVVEAACSFFVHCGVALTESARSTECSGVSGVLSPRVHAVAAVITAAVYAGGSTTGAVFNPVLAFSTQFPCTGNTFMEYSLIYWIGPLLGMGCFFLLVDQIIPTFSTKKSKLEVEKKKMK